MNCSSCGGQLIGGQKFCAKCGAPAPAASGYRPPGWDDRATPGIPAVKPAAQKKPPPKKTAVAQRVEQNWTPPPGASAPQPDAKAGADQPVAQTRKKNSLPKIKLPSAASMSVPAKNFADSVSSAFSTMGKSFPNKKIILAAALAALVVIIIVAKLSCGKNSGDEKSAGGLPEGVVVINEKIEDGVNQTKIETIAVAGKASTQDEIEKILKTMFGFQKKRTGFASKSAPTSISIYLYSSETVFTSDPDWWLGRLLWDNSAADPQISFNLEALMPRQDGSAEGGILSRAEFIEQSEDKASGLSRLVDQLGKDFREFEKLTMSEDDFRTKAEKASDELYEATRTLPDTDSEDCGDLRQAFLDLVDATQYFQDIFAPGSNVFIDSRLNTEEFHQKLSDFSAAEGAFMHELDKIKVD